MVLDDLGTETGGMCGGTNGMVLMEFTSVWKAILHTLKGSESASE